MNEENPNQPPLETGSTAPDQRPRRPRRRYPRRRFYNRGDRNDNSNSSYDEPRGEGQDFATATAADPMGGEAQDRQLPTEGEGGADAQREPEFGEGIIEISGKVSVFYVMLSVISFRHLRTFLLRRKRSAVLVCATECGSTEKHAAVIAARS